MRPPRSIAEKAFARIQVKRRAISVVLVLVVAGGAWLIFNTMGRGGTSIELSLSSSRAPGTASGSSAPITGVTAVVHVVGAVKKPGLYTLKPNSRVIDAIMAAGGLLLSSDECALNFARVVSDGEQLVVPARQAPNVVCAASASNAGGASGARKVSLGQASAAELDSLPGIGPALAARIIEWRTSHGGFKRVNDLDNVSGIGPSLLAQITPLVTV